MKESNQLGFMTELQCQKDFTRYGILLSQPIMSDSKYDFIADIKGKLYKIQCKSSVIAEDGSFIRFKCCMTDIRHGRTYYTDEDVDYFYTYYNDKSYLVPINVGGKAEKTLRFSALQNHATIIWAKDYTLENQLSILGYDYKSNEYQQTITKG